MRAQRSYRSRKELFVKKPSRPAAKMYSSWKSRWPQPSEPESTSASRTGVMVIDIGGGTTDIAVISLGGIVASSSVKMAGDKFDEAIVKYMRKAHKLYIGERTAEELKMTIGTAFPREEVISRECRGRDLVTGLPKSVEVTSEEIMDALDEPLHEICETVHNVLERTPPELAADISNSGIVVTGGGALLYGIDKRIEDRTGIKVIIAEDPKSCVAIGTGKALNELDSLKSTYLNRGSLYLSGWYLQKA